MALKIPERYRAGFGVLIGLSDQSMEELLGALTTVSSSLAAKGHRRLVADIATKVPSIPQSDIRNIVVTIISLYIARADREASVVDFAEDLCRAVERSQDGQLELTKENRDAFKQRLVRLLGFDSFNIGAKAADIGHEYEHSLCSLRILTDMRPVFGDSIGELPAGAVVTHTLKMVYHQGNQLKEFFVVLDEKQIGILRGLLDRRSEEHTSELQSQR